MANTKITSDNLDTNIDIAGTLGVGGNVTVAAGKHYTTASGNDLNIVYPDTRSLFIKEGSTTHVTVDNEGKVGIGDTPAAQLHVEHSSGTAYNGATELTESIIVSNKAGTDDSGVNNVASIGLHVADGATSQGFINYVRTGNNTGNFTFTQRTGSSTYAEAMRITSVGDVCIGGSNDVHTNADIGPSLHILSDTSGVDVSLHLHPDVGEYSLYAYNGYLAILDHTASAERMRIDSTGRVGINRTPAISNSKLEVGGADNVPLINVEASGATAGIGIGGGSLKFFYGTSAKMNLSSSGNLEGLENLYVAEDIGHSGDSNTYMSWQADQLDFYMGGNHISEFTTGGIQTRAGFDCGAGGGTYGNMFCSTNLSGYSNGQYPVLKTGGATIHFDAQSTYTGYISHNTGFTDVSDEREKENIETITGATALVKQLRGVTHKWKDKRDEETHHGLIAQEVQKVVPDVVSEGAKKEGQTPTLGVAYQKLVPLLIESIKELEARIEALES